MTQYCHSDYDLTRNVRVSVCSSLFMSQSHLWQAGACCRQGILQNATLLLQLQRSKSLCLHSRLPYKAYTKALECLPSSLFLILGVYLSYFKQDFDCLGFAGRPVMRFDV